MCWWLWPMRKSVVMHGPQGKILLFLHGLVGNLCWFYLWRGPIYSMGNFLHNSPWRGGGVGEGGCLYALDPRGSPPMILYFTGDLVDYLNSWGSSLVTSNPLRGAFDTFHSLGMLWGSLCPLPNWGFFVILVHSLNLFFFSLPTFWEPTRIFDFCLFVCLFLFLCFCF